MAGVQWFRCPEDGAIFPLVVHHFKRFDPDETTAWERVGRPVPELSLLAAVSSWIWSSHSTQEGLTLNRQLVAACMTAAKAVVAAPIVTSLVRLMSSSMKFLGILHISNC